MRNLTLLLIGAALALPAPQARAADVAAGQARYAETCANCHGRTGRGMASFPSIKGRDADYIAMRLNQYRAGERLGPNALLMIPMAAELTDEEIDNLSAFVSATFR